MKRNERTLSPHEKLSRYLRAHNMRNTDERKQILDTVLTIPDGFRPKDLLEQLEEAGFHVSVPTIYASLELFIEAGLLRSWLDEQGHKTFSPIESAKPRTVIRCTMCGKTKQVNVSELPGLLLHRRYWGYIPTTYYVRIDALCSKCSKQMARIK